MNDADLIHKSTPNLTATDGGAVIDVCKISWPQTWKPVGTSLTAAKLPSGTSPGKIRKTIQEFLRDMQYFQVCRECEERKPRGRYPTGRSASPAPN